MSTFFHVHVVSIFKNTDLTNTCYIYLNLVKGADSPVLQNGVDVNFRTCFCSYGLITFHVTLLDVPPSRCELPNWQWCTLHLQIEKLTRHNQIAVVSSVIPNVIRYSPWYWIRVFMKWTASLVTVQDFFF